MASLGSTLLSSSSRFDQDLHRQDIEEQFNSFDLNGDGFIDREELAFVLKDLDKNIWTDSRLDQLLQKVDLNQDGKIELQEFLTWVFSATMLYCICGFTCGTRKAFEKHIQRFSREPDGKTHGLSRRVFARQSSLASLSGDDVGDELRELELPAPLVEVSPLVPTPERGELELPLTDCAPRFGSRPSRELRRSLSRSLPPGKIQREITLPPLPSPLASVGVPSIAISGPPVRLLVVRHAQSGNKSRGPREVKQRDPGLTPLGLDQAQKLGIHLRHELRGSAGSRSLVVVCSPMRRCILTILPTLASLRLPVEDCICHGGAYEFGCAGTSFSGTQFSEIVREFPEFSSSGFTPCGHWDYRGSNERENELEAKARMTRLAKYLVNEAAQVLRSRESGIHTRTLVLVAHQTIADLLCQILVDGTDRFWVYGDIRYRLQNAGITELMIWPDGTTTIVTRNNGTHLLSLKDQGRSPFVGHFGVRP